MADAADAAGPKGQRRFTWDDPGWTEGNSGQGRFTCFPLGDADHGPLIVVIEYAPDLRIGVHHHTSDYCSMVIKGEIEVTRKRETVGSMRLVRGGTAYGPLVVGPEGCTVVEFFEDRTTFATPVYLQRDDRLAAVGSPMPGLVRQLVGQAWD
jgi:hypothetical protein